MLILAKWHRRSWVRRSLVDTVSPESGFSEELFSLWAVGPYVRSPALLFFMSASHLSNAFQHYPVSREHVKVQGERGICPTSLGPDCWNPCVSSTGQVPPASLLTPTELEQGRGCHAVDSGMWWEGPEGPTYSLGYLGAFQISLTFIGLIEH